MASCRSTRTAAASHRVGCEGIQGAKEMERAAPQLPRSRAQCTMRGTRLETGEGRSRQRVVRPFARGRGSNSGSERGTGESGRGCGGEATKPCGGDQDNFRQSCRMAGSPPQQSFTRCFFRCQCFFAPFRHRHAGRRWNAARPTASNRPSTVTQIRQGNWKMPPEPSEAE